MKRCSRLKSGKRCRNEAAMMYEVENVWVKLCADHMHLEDDESFMKETAKRIKESMQHTQSTES